jgi:autotransporter-associated beta strand protein
MNRRRILSTVAAVGFTGFLTTHATAQLADFVWIPANTGAQAWQDNTKWTAPIFPGGYPYTIPTFPNDPGRVDSDSNATAGELTDLIEFPVVGANVSVALGANLNLDVGASNVTVASLQLGGTSGAVTTNITSSGGKLVFENYEVNRTGVSPDACSFNCAAALVTSGGVAGSTNIISAPIHINGERLEFSSASTNNLTISGPITFANLTTTGTGFSGAPGLTSIRSFMPSGTKLTISGTISLVDTVAAAGAQLTLHDNGTLSSPTAPPESVNNVSTGTIEISGVIEDAAAASGSSSLFIGTQSANQALGTLILSGTNTFRGATTLNRANLVLANNSALGVDTALGDDRNGGASFSGNQNPSNQFGFNILSDNDSRTISVDARLAQWLTVTGTNSLTWAGLMTQNNTRGIDNLLPAGKTFTISGVVYGSSISSTDTAIENRIFTFDGPGTTLSTGGLRDKIKGGVAVVTASGLGHFRKAGTGTALVSDPGGVSDFTGDVLVDQGVIRFASDAIFDQARNVQSFGGAIGVDTGTFTNTNLLTKLRSMSPGLSDLNLYDGGLMLTSGEANNPIDFTSGDLALLSNMSVAPPQNGISYTGTITPAADAVTTVPTYRLGGGNGVLTLPSNQLTGASNVQVTNGGEVQLNGLNTYSGVTRIQAKYHTTTQNQAAANTSTNVSNVVYEGTTLTVNTLLNGGANSSIGSSSNAASNLVIQGSTLKYAGTGSNGTSDRLFTVGTGGATLDASGTSGSAMNFTNTGALVMGLAAAQDHATFIDAQNIPDGMTGNVNTRTRVQLNNVDDIIVGMNIIGPAPLAAPGLAISAVNTPLPNLQRFMVTVPQQNGVSLPDFTATFSGVARTLTLTGSSTANNTLSPLVADATGTLGGSNVVNVAKNGTGKWILTNNNTYTGTTSVNAGTLLINGAQTGTGVTTVAAGATLGGTGTLGGAITNNGTIGPGASVGTLNVNGNVTMSANSHFAAELSGANADKLAITGNLDLAALANFLDVTGVGTGGSWIIATYTGTLTGTFETITPGYAVNYGTGSNSQITLMTAVGLPGDFNSDGKVDAGDYVTWRKNNGTNNALANDNGLGTPIGPAHHALWRSNFGNPPGAGSGLGAGAVPEPSGVLLIVVVLGAAIGSIRRRD